MAVLLVAGVALAGCAPLAVAPGCAAGQTRQQEVELFFGGSVADAAWAAFAADVLTPAFPDGFTVYAAAGQWRDPRNGRVVRETSRVVQVFAARLPAGIEAVRASYRVRFGQGSVGLVTRQACAAFQEDGSLRLRHNPVMTWRWPAPVDRQGD